MLELPGPGEGSPSCVGSDVQRALVLSRPSHLKGALWSREAKGRWPWAEPQGRRIFRAAGLQAPEPRTPGAEAQLPAAAPQTRNPPLTLDPPGCTFGASLSSA